MVRPLCFWVYCKSIGYAPAGILGVFPVPIPVAPGCTSSRQRVPFSRREVLFRLAEVADTRGRHINNLKLSPFPALHICGGYAETAAAFFLRLGGARQYFVAVCKCIACVCVCRTSRDGVGGYDLPALSPYASNCGKGREAAFAPCVFLRKKTTGLSAEIFLLFQKGKSSGRAITITMPIITCKGSPTFT